MGGAVWVAAGGQWRYFATVNQRGTRMKVLVRDGQGLWLLAPRLHQGRFSFGRRTAWLHTSNSTRRSVSGRPIIPSCGI